MSESFASRLRTKILHEGREGSAAAFMDSAREVPVLPTPPRKRRSVTPADVTEVPQ